MAKGQELCNHFITLVSIDFDLAFELFSMFE